MTDQFQLTEVQLAIQDMAHSKGNCVHFKDWISCRIYGDLP